MDGKAGTPLVKVVLSHAGTGTFRGPLLRTRLSSAEAAGQGSSMGAAIGPMEAGTCTTGGPQGVTAPRF